MLVIGSRGSQLAQWQAKHIQSKLETLGIETRIEIIKTSGDKIQDVPLAKVGGKGLFTKEIEDALLDRSIDLAVHSMKDLPVEMPTGLVLAGMPEREDPRDAMVGGTLAALADGMVIGTSSLRRSSQLLALHPGLKIEMLRGNVDTRLRKLDKGAYNAIVLAAAGLKRLGWADRITDTIPIEIMCPAAGQGALAIETRDDHGDAWELAQRLDHPATRITVSAERALLATLGGGCQVPVGAHARLENGVVHLIAVVASPAGDRIVRDEITGVDPQTTGADLGRRMLEQGGREILDEVYSA